MLHKMGFDCICETCGAPKTLEQMREDGECCNDCYVKYIDADRRTLAQILKQRDAAQDIDKNAPHYVRGLSKGVK